MDSYRPSLGLDLKKVEQLKKELNVSVERSEFGYYHITFSFENSIDHFTFLYTPRVQNIEKTEYEVSSLEALAVFIGKFKEFMYHLRVRYAEVMVSAYKPAHQQLFYNAELRPRGYIPSWKYDSFLNSFEDYLMFNWFKGRIENIRLIDEAIELKGKLNLVS